MRRHEKPAVFIILAFIVDHAHVTRSVNIRQAS
jgi:hypothetical protein